MKLNQIPRDGQWGGIADQLNENFEKVDIVVESLKDVTIKNYGYYSTLDALQKTHPKAIAGSKAYVGASYPYAIYLWDDSASAWVDSGSTGGEENVKLEDYYTKENVDEKLAELEEKVDELEQNGGGGGVIGNLTGYVVLDSTSELPTTASTLGYLIGNNLYVYVGEGGDVNNGTYKNCGEFRGPQGEQGPAGAEGSPGITSAEVSVDDTSGTPTVAASIDNKVLKLNFSGLKGAQGNSGYQGAADELEVVNNLTQGGAAAALSAEMGKKLNEELLQFGTITEEVVNNEDFVLNNGYLAATTIGKEATITSGSSLRYSNPMAVLKGDIVEVESQGTGIACIATTDATGSSYIARAISNDGDAIRTYTYEVEEDGYIAISSRAVALKGKVLRKIGKDRLGELENEVSKITNDLYKEPQIEGEIDVTSEFTETVGQSYGTVGSAIQKTSADIWRHIKVTKSVVSLGRFTTIVPAGAVNPSSVVQYVDSNDVVVSIEGTGLVAGNIYEGDINFPEGATAVYISGGKGLFKVYAGLGEAVFEKKFIVGDVYKLKTESKILVDAINEVKEVADNLDSILIKEEVTTDNGDITSNYQTAYGQSYGTIGGAIRFAYSEIWRYLKIYKGDGAKKVKITVPSNSSPSSVIQYVDSNNIIISLAGTGLSGGTIFEYELSFPEGATAVYISSDEYTAVVYGAPQSSIIKKNIIGDVSELKTESKTLVDAINEIVSVYPVTELTDISDTFSFTYGQAYGNVGGTIVITDNTAWRHIRITKADNISIIKVSASYNVSSLIQYVDDNDVIISRDLISPIAGTLYEQEISFPEGATAVYVSSYPNAPMLLRRVAIDAAPSTPSTPSTPSFRFRVLSWNIGHYAKGNNTSSGITEETYESEKMAFRKVFNNYAADIVGLCEYSSIFYGEETATDAILSQYKYSYIAPTQSGYIGTALYSSFKLTKLEEISVGGYKAYEGHFTANGKDIIICMAHLPWQSQEQNLSAINTLLTRYADSPNVVIMGDFNWSAGHEEEYAALFTKAGYQLANWGYLGKILTSYNNVIASNYLDNVAVKGGCILHTEVLQNTPEGKDPDAPVLDDEVLWDAVNLSDHFPIICDIVL